MTTAAGVSHTERCRRLFETRVLLGCAGLSFLPHYGAGGAELTGACCRLHGAWSASRRAWCSAGLRWLFFAAWPRAEQQPSTLRASATRALHPSTTPSGWVGNSVISGASRNPSSTIQASSRHAVPRLISCGIAGTATSHSGNSSAPLLISSMPVRSRNSCPSKSNLTASRRPQVRAPPCRETSATTLRWRSS